MVSVPRHDNDKSFRAGVSKATRRAVEKRPAPPDPDERIVPVHRISAKVTLPQLKFMEGKPNEPEPEGGRSGAAPPRGDAEGDPGEPRRRRPKSRLAATEPDRDREGAGSDGVAAGPLRPGLGQGANLNPEVGEVEIGYRNHRGEQSLRRIRPLRFFYGRTRGLKTACYQLHAKDLDLGAFRDFALHDISSWRELA
jgi:hypothetical protein